MYDKKITPKNKTKTGPQIFLRRVPSRLSFMAHRYKQEHKIHMKRKKEISTLGRVR